MTYASYKNKGFANFIKLIKPGKNIDYPKSQSSIYTIDLFNNILEYYNTVVVFPLPLSPKIRTLLYSLS